MPKYGGKPQNRLTKMIKMFYLHFYKVLVHSHQCPSHSSFQRNQTYTHRGKHSLHQHICLHFGKDYCHIHCSLFHTNFLCSLADMYRRTHSPCQYMCYHDDRVIQHSHQCQSRRTFLQIQADSDSENQRRGLGMLPRFCMDCLGSRQCLSHR